MIVVDTDILIWVLRGQQEMVQHLKIVWQEEQGNVWITPIQVAEIYAGLRVGEENKIAALFSAFQCLSLNAVIGKLAGEYLLQYKKSHGVLLADALIAAASEVHQAKLWTLNKKHYPMFTPERFKNKGLTGFA